MNDTTKRQFRIYFVENGDLKEVTYSYPGHSFELANDGNGLIVTNTNERTGDHYFNVTRLVWENVQENTLPKISYTLAVRDDTFLDIRKRKCHSITTGLAEHIKVGDIVLIECNKFGSIAREVISIDMRINTVTFK